MSQEPGSSEEPTACCTVCGRSFALCDLTWETAGLLCSLCLAEKESCGCSD